MANLNFGNLTLPFIMFYYVEMTKWDHEVTLLWSVAAVLTTEVSYGICVCMTESSL